MGVPGRRCSAASTASPASRTGSSWCAERGGVEWVNDSKATNVDSTVVGARRLPGREAVGLLIARRPRQGAPYAPLPAALPGAREGARSPSARTRRPSSGSSATSAPPSPAATSPPPWRAPPASPARATWCCSPRPARATISSGDYEERGEAFRRLASEVRARHERRHRPRRRRARLVPPLDPWLLAAVLLLTGIGLVMVYSASAVTAEARVHDSSTTSSGSWWPPASGSALLLVFVKLATGGSSAGLPAAPRRHGGARARCSSRASARWPAAPGAGSTWASSASSPPRSPRWRWCSTWPARSPGRRSG